MSEGASYGSGGINLPSSYMAGIIDELYVTRSEDEPKEETVSQPTTTPAQIVTTCVLTADQARSQKLNVARIFANWRTLEHEIAVTHRETVVGVVKRAHIESGALFLRIQFDTAPPAGARPMVPNVEVYRDLDGKGPAIRRVEMVPESRVQLVGDDEEQIARAAPGGGCWQGTGWDLKNKAIHCGKPDIATASQPNDGCVPDWRVCWEHAAELSREYPDHTTVTYDDGLNGAPKPRQPEREINNVGKAEAAKDAEKRKQSTRLWRRHRKRQLEWERCGHPGTDQCIHSRRMIVAYGQACRFAGIEPGETTIGQLQAIADRKREKPAAPTLTPGTSRGWDQRFTV